VHRRQQRGHHGLNVGVNAAILTGLDLGSTFTNVPGGSADWTFSNANYADDSGSVDITITKAPQTITFAFISDKTVGEGTFELVASSGSVLGVTFTSLTPDVCTVSGTTVTIVTAGTCTIQADQAGDVNHAAAEAVTQSFEISAAPTPPDTSRSGAAAGTTSGSGPLPWVVLIGILTAFAATAAFMVLMLKRQRDEDRGQGHIE